MNKKHFEIKFVRTAPDVAWWCVYNNVTGHAIRRFFSFVSALVFKEELEKKESFKNKSIKRNKINDNRG